MIALILVLPATLIGLVLLLVVTSELERQLSRSVRPAQLRNLNRRVPATASRGR